MIRKCILGLALVVPCQIPAAYWGDLMEEANGSWDDDLCAIHMIHMSGGRYLVWGYGTAIPNQTKTWVWNSNTGSVSGPYVLNGANIFCCGVSQLSDGRPIIAGGTINQADGIKETYIFNPATNVWTEATGELNEPRWYPTLALRSDGVLSAISGWIKPGTPNTWATTVELFNTSTQTWSSFAPGFHANVGGTFTPHFYPFMIPYHDILEPTIPKLFFAGRATASDFGNIRSSLRTFSLAFTGSGSAQWRSLGGDSGIQGSGAVIMFDRTDPLDVGTVYKFGGEQGGLPVAAGRRIDLNQGQQAAWIATGSMTVPRAECNLVVLPTGRIAAVGGADAAGPHNLFGDAIYTVEIYDPITDGWSDVSPNMERPRMYHSTASLTPNATILTAGGEWKLTHGGPVESEFNAQEYFPTYFETDVVRPGFIDWPRTASWNTTITVRVSGPVSYFSLLKLTSTTHANDMTQRFIKLTPAQASSGQYHYLKMPKNGGVAPPGNYMLFAINGSMPSVAAYIRITP
jgi:galactose oxidase